MDYCLSPKGTTTLSLEREKNGHPEPFDIPYWGVGNENWGGGGNMSPDHYANECRRFSRLMTNAFPHVELYACGENAFDYEWTDGVMRNLRGAEKVTKGFTMHYYCGEAGDPVAFTQDEWTKQLKQAADIEKIIKRNWNIISAYDMDSNIKLIIDEWGCWHKDGTGPSKGEKLFEQQSTMRDAMVSALSLNIFNNHCDKIRRFTGLYAFYIHYYYFLFAVWTFFHSPTNALIKNVPSHHYPSTSSIRVSTVRGC